MLWLKTGYSHDYSTIKWKILKILSCFYSVKRLHKNIQKLITLHNVSLSSNKFYVNYGSLYNANREVFPKKWFEKTANIEFEGKEFPVPSEYGKTLEKIYGDYKKLPPYSKRFPKHSYFVNSK